MKMSVNGARIKQATSSSFKGHRRKFSPERNKKNKEREYRIRKERYAKYPLDEKMTKNSRLIEPD